MAYPGAIPTFAGFTAGHTLAVDNHAAQHNLEQSEIVAIATKIGTGASTPTSGMVLRSNGAGTSVWGQVVLTTDVTGVLPLANLPTTSLLDLVYPVGSIYTETTGTNPGVTFGFGTWVAYGQGQVLVGAGTSDQLFTAGTSGGESNHALTSNEMPSHTHVQDSHTHTTTLPANSTAGGTGNFFAGNNAGSLIAPSSATIATNQNTGGSATHNNLQPYIVVYFWRRTA